MAKRMRIKEYAIKHRKSVFEVIKLVKAGKLPSETIEEGGKETVYIVLDEEQAPTRQEPKPPEISLEEQVKRLNEEVQRLRQEMEQIKKVWQ